MEQLTAMAQRIGDAFGRIGWPVHVLILVGILVAFGVLFRFVPKLRPYTGQLLLALGILWVGTVFFFLTFTFRVPLWDANAIVTARSMPRVWYAALVPSVILTVIFTLTGKDDPDPKWGNVKLVALILTGLIVSLGLFNFIGYYISSALFMVYTMWLLGSRKPLELICLPVGWVLFSYFIFARLLNVRLPIGSLINNILNAIG